MIGTPKELIAWLFDQPADALFELKERRKRRSLTQNAYYWVLVNQLARMLGMPDSELHGRLIRDYGVCGVGYFRTDVVNSGFIRYWDEIVDPTTGECTVTASNGSEYAHIRIWKGSSEMDSREFSHLLDGVRQECIDQGIPVMTPEEVARLRFVGEVAA